MDFSGTSGVSGLRFINPARNHTAPPTTVKARSQRTTVRSNGRSITGQPDNCAIVKRSVIQCQPT